MQKKNSKKDQTVTISFRSQDKKTTSSKSKSSDVVHSLCLWVWQYGPILFFFFQLLSWMLEPDCLDTCCFGCLICMCFVFAPVQCNWAGFTRKGALEIHSIITIIVLTVTGENWYSHHLFGTDCSSTMPYGTNNLHMLRAPDQNSTSRLYNILEIHHLVQNPPY